MDVPEPLCSTGCFSRDPDLASIDLVVHGMRQLPLASFEVMFYSAWFDNPTKAARLITGTRSATPVLHAEKSIGPSLTSNSPAEVEEAFAKFEITCRFAQTISAQRIVLHLWGLPDSDAIIDRNLAGLPRLLDTADQYGLTLSIETLLCQISTPLDVVARCRMVDRRATITLDTAFLAIQGQLGAAVVDDRLWPTAVDHVHLKDYGDPGLGWGKAPYLHPGDGSLDLTGFLKGIDARGFKGTVTLESPALRDDEPDIARIETSLDWIRSTRDSPKPPDKMPASRE